MRPRIIVHTGAGSNHAVRERLQAAKLAVSRGLEFLKSGAPAVYGVKEAIKVLEDSGVCNAGRGAYLQLDGKRRYDASLMTSGLQVGGVIQCYGIKNPIDLAFYILKQKYLTHISGDGALKVSQEIGMEEELESPPHVFGVYKKFREVVGDRRTYAEISEVVNNFLEENNLRHFHNGTVGCVAIDSQGNLASGSSTGGMFMAMIGRVGDSAQIGCGNYCNEDAGVSVTGLGELVIPLTVAREVVDKIGHGMNPQLACEAMVRETLQKEGDIGIISIDKEGDIGKFYSSEMMPIAYN